MMGRNIRTPYFDSLPSGKSLTFGKVLGRYFQKPAIYKVRWQGDNFRSAESSFRVLPGKR